MDFDVFEGQKASRIQRSNGNKKKSYKENMEQRHARVGFKQHRRELFEQDFIEYEKDLVEED